MSGKKIRLFQKKDADQCCEIIKACIPKIGGLNEAARDFLSLKNKPKKLFEELSKYYTLVFEQNGKIIGLGALDGNEVKRVYVKPNQHGKGIGSKITELLESEARKRGIKKLFAQSSPNAKVFYQKLGYKVLNKGTLVKKKASFRFINMEKNLEGKK